MAGALEEVLAVNAAFYASFEAGSVGGMITLWEHSDEVSCTHPGWPTLHGWEQVRRSWEGILRNDVGLQFIVTEERAVVRGEAGWVSCQENIIGPQGPRGTASALNLFARNFAGVWKMVGHHGAPVMATMLD